MKVLIILEVIKMLAWAYILTLLIVKRKYIPINKRWIGLISSALMVLASIQDIYNYHSLEVKSILWLVASGFIIAFYITVVNKCCQSNKHLDRSINEFIEKIEQDKKTLL